MYRVVLGDTPAERLSDFDPVVRMIWADRYGVECETVLVGTIARAVSGILDSAGLAEGAACYCLLVPYAQSPLFGARPSRAGDYDVDAVLPGIVNRRVRVFSHAWRKVVERLRHWLA